ncbi:translational GTPase TypA [Candidatus Berkiella aquae]|uniref:Large ribosomal subunit assembly factor BipA n=1 Tax=Candidatus Berkiella aquae TaxID=295108 RepID=A0A0Q9YX84_9GAMM|nr:translational GTPase TypA [Candidatus Berkiella aquae]MCS5712659.1 translational GTPase TypA [Candidatus Berkiella aquae]
MQQQLRNIAIIAHVDHGKTTLVDRLLQQSGTLDARMGNVNCIMDSNDLEKERGITILAKNTAIKWRDYRINIVDTPGHADFGGEVERILSMVDAVLLLVDAVDGPMPQTRFVTQKAFAQGLRPIVVVNKVDRPGSRPSWVIDRVFDLFDKLGATEEQLDFPVVYTSALLGTATTNLAEPGTDMTPLFEEIVKRVEPPVCDPNGPFQMQISSLDYSSYVGTIGIGLIKRGTIKSNTQVSIIDSQGRTRPGKVLQILGYLGLERIEQPEGKAGEIVAITGIEPLAISDTICDKGNVEALPALKVDEPTISMTFQVNTSPFAGLDGKFVTSRQIRERLARECLHNVALRVEDTEDPDKFRVSGRGELHLSILIETMRREGYEIAVSRPEVILHKEGEEILEPYETLAIDVEEKDQGPIMEQLGARRGQLVDMMPDGKGRVRMDYVIPSRGLIGFHSLFLTLTSGTGIATHVFDHYGPYKPGTVASRLQGVMIANAAGKATAYSLWGLQARGRLLIGPQTEVYEGMIVGIHSRDNDLVVNVTKGKQLTNIRAAGTDENIILTPHIKQSLEQSLEFIEDDELVEVTPNAIRIRKKFLKEHERKRDSRSNA